MTAADDEAELRQLRDKMCNLAIEAARLSHDRDKIQRRLTTIALESRTLQRQIWELQGGEDNDDEEEVAF